MVTDKPLVMLYTVTNQGSTQYEQNRATSRFFSLW